MDVLTRIKQLVIARRVEFAMKAELERLRDGLSVEDVLESVVNANALKKTLRSRLARRSHPGRRLSMSSPPRSSPTERRQSAGRCPRCGSNRIAEVVEDVELRIGRRSHRFAAVPHEHCRACGERIFGIKASKRFDAGVLKGRRRPSEH